MVRGAINCLLSVLSAVNCDCDGALTIAHATKNVVAICSCYSVTKFGRVYIIIFILMSNTQCVPASTKEINKIIGTLNGTTKKIALVTMIGDASDSFFYISI